MVKGKRTSATALAPRVSVSCYLGMHCFQPAEALMLVAPCKRPRSFGRPANLLLIISHQARARRRRCPRRRTGERRTRGQDRRKGMGSACSRSLPLGPETRSVLAACPWPSSKRSALTRMLGRISMQPALTRLEVEKRPASGQKPFRPCPKVGVELDRHWRHGPRCGSRLRRATLEAESKPPLRPCRERRC
jgi:hypothetical protein